MPSNAQDNIRDSLVNVIIQGKHDTLVVDALLSLGNEMVTIDYDSALACTQQAKEITLRNLRKKDLPEIVVHEFKDALASIYNNLGYLKQLKDDHEAARAYYRKGFEIRKAEGSTERALRTLTSICSGYEDQGDIMRALEVAYEGLGYAEQWKDSSAMSKFYTTISYLQFSQKEYKAMIKTLTKVVDLEKKIGDPISISKVYNNMAVAYSSLDRWDEALVFHKRSLALRKQVGFEAGVASSMGNIGRAYEDLGDTVEAMKYYMEALRINESIGAVTSTARVYKRLADLKLKQGDVRSAKKYGEKGLKLTRMRNHARALRDMAYTMAKVYRASGDYKEAVEMYDTYVTLKDTLFNQENQRAILQSGFKYDFEKQHLADSVDFAKKEEIAKINHANELQQEANQRYALYGGLGFLLLLGGVAFRGYQRKKKDNKLIVEQKQEVEHQKELVEEKNQEIMDSITYAQRIQEAILPPDRLVQQWLSNSFVLYKPKDIVAGDFYWMEVVGDLIIFSVADCTGHGVPGAMVSVVCHNALNRAVREFGLTAPGEILDKTREIVVEQFSKSDKDVKDGMDVALCALNNKTGELQYAGANNPLWIITSNRVHHSETIDSLGPREMYELEERSETLLFELKATKEPIGKTDNPGKFGTHSIQLVQGDCLYIFSDGFADQFGGAKGKKFKYKPFKKLLLNNHQKPLMEQRNIIDTEFETWRGDLEQIDDVCVIGVRV